MLASLSSRAAPRAAVENRDLVGWPTFTAGRGSPVRAQVSGYSYSSSEALQVAAVVACIGLRAGALAQIPLKGYDSEGPLGVVLDPQPELLARPSYSVVRSVWKTQMSISRDLWGYAAGKILALDGAGYPSKVDWLPPDEVKARQEYVGGPLVWTIGRSEIDASLVFHVPSRWVMPGNPLGMSPLEKSGLVDLAKRAQEFGRGWFADGAVPSSVLYSDQELTSDQADSLLERILSRWKGRQPAVIGSGLKYEQVSVAANESQFLDTMIKAASDIAISFNLPPAKIAAAMSSSEVTYQNLEQNTQQYLMDSVNPDLVVIQEVMETHMRPGTYPRWKTAAFLQSDLKTRYESYQIGIEAGFLDEDEPREWEELGPRKPRTELVDVRNIAEMAQKLYLAKGVILSDEEIRDLLNQAGGNFPGALPAAP